MTNIRDLLKTYRSPGNKSARATIDPRLYSPETNLSKDGIEDESFGFYPFGISGGLVEFLSEGSRTIADGAAYIAISKATLPEMYSEERQGQLSHAVSFLTMCTQYCEPPIEFKGDVRSQINKMISGIGEIIANKSRDLPPYS